MTAKENKPQRTVIRLSVTSIRGIISEAAKVYRLVRHKKMTHEEARHLFSYLDDLREMMETAATIDEKAALGRLEDRLEELAEIAERRNGYATGDRSIGQAH